MRRYLIFVFGLVLFFVSLFFDRHLVLLFTSFRNPVFDLISFAFYKTSVQVFVFFIVPFCILWFLDRRRAVLFGLGFCLVVLFTYSLKFLVMKPRPFLVMGLPLLSSLSYSFANFNTSLPSSHASSSFSAFAALEKSRFLSYAWLLLALLSVFTRLYAGVHYFSDAVLGALLGYFVTHSVFFLDKKYGFSRKWIRA